METPTEIRILISSYLGVNDKCSYLTTCKAINQTLCNDSFWLDFAYKHLLRGLTIEEIIILVFLKADQEKLAKSRISKFQNYLKNKCGSSVDLPAILKKEESKPSSEIRFGDYTGTAWREWGSYQFASNFIALFCRPVKLTALQGDKEEMKLLWTLHGTSITDLTYKHSSFGKCTDYLGDVLPNLTKFKSLGGEYVTEVLERVTQNMTQLQAFALDIDDGQTDMLVTMTNLTKLKDTAYWSHESKEKLLQALGPNLIYLGVSNMSDADMDSLAKWCKKLRSLRLVVEKHFPKKVFEAMSELAKNVAEFPQKLKVKAGGARRVHPPKSLGADEDSSFFFKNFGSRLLKLTLRNLAYSHVEHLAHASNLVALDLSVTDDASGVAGAANVTVPQVIAQLAKLVDLKLELTTQHQTSIVHPHVTRIHLRLENCIIDAPALVDLKVFKGVFGIERCSLKSLHVDTEVTGLHQVLNVDWSTLTSLNGAGDIYWGLVDRMPENVVLQKGCLGHVECSFRATKNQSVMPPVVKIRHDQVMALADVDYIAQPKELTIENPVLDLAFYKVLVSKFHAIEELDFYGCANITTEALEILCDGLPNLKRIGFTESRDVNAPFSHLKLHSKSLELIYLYHIHSVETSDIVCPNLRTITFDNAGRYNSLDDVTDTNFCEMTLQQLGETNSCTNMMNYTAYPTQTHPDGIYTLKPPTKPGQYHSLIRTNCGAVKLTRVPAHLQFLRLYLNMNLIEVDFESDNLTEVSFDSCYHLKKIKIRAPLRLFSFCYSPLEELILDSKLMKSLDIPTQVKHIELHTPNLKELKIVAAINFDFFDGLTNLEQLTVREEDKNDDTDEYNNNDDENNTSDDENNDNDENNNDDDENNNNDNEKSSSESSAEQFDAAALFAKLLSFCPRLKVLTWKCDDSSLGRISA